MTFIHVYRFFSKKCKTNHFKYCFRSEMCCFIRDFQSFWFVHCDVGRAVVDVFGCLCACLIVILFSKMIDSKSRFISRFLSYFVKSILLVVSVHITELNVFSWWKLTDKFVQLGLPEFWQLIALISVKLVFDLTCAYVLSKISFVKKVYGLNSD